MRVLPGWTRQCSATLLCVAGPSTRQKAPTRRESFKRIGIPVLAAVLSLTCLVSIGFLGTAPLLPSPFAQPWLSKHSSGARAQLGPLCHLLAEPQALRPPSSGSSVLSPHFPSVKVYLEYHYFFCKQPLKLVPLQQVCDGNVDCLQGEDEANCPQWVREGPPAGGESMTPP